MNHLQEFIEHWESSLNQDQVLKRRIEHSKSTILEGRTIVELEVKGEGIVAVELREKRFYIKKGKAGKPLLGLSLPPHLFKEMLLTKGQILYLLLDKEATISFDTPCFNHWDGITALTLLLNAQEMVRKDVTLQKMVGQL